MSRNSLFDIGYDSGGTYKKTYIVKGTNHSKPTSQYACWSGILIRCYSEAYLDNKPNYRGCGICEEWKDFQVFAKWYDENYWEIENEKMNLDKDILVKGNKIYSPSACIFVPKTINMLFCKNFRLKNKCLPIGVHSKYNKYYGKISLGSRNNSIYYPLRNTIEEAFNDYKRGKESYIKQIADEYKEKYPNFPQKLYDAMYMYEVEIDD